MPSLPSLQFIDRLLNLGEVLWEKRSNIKVEGVALNVPQDWRGSPGEPFLQRLRRSTRETQTQTLEALLRVASSSGLRLERNPLDAVAESQLLATLREIAPLPSAVPETESCCPVRYRVSV